jgi:Tol biopolymer transport system component
VAAALAAAAALLLPAPAGATFAGANGLIARAARDGIHVALPDGSGDVRITRRSPYPYEGSLAWGPHGRRIAFSAGYDTYDVFVVDPSSGTTHRVTHGSSHDLAPSWSPDGHWITFLGARTDGTAIYRVAASGGPVKRILRAPYITDVERAPRGSLIAYTAGNPTGSAGEDVYTVAANGTGARRIVDFPDGSRVASVSWSPDADELALEVQSDCGERPVMDCGQIWTVHRDGSDLRPRTAGPGQHPNKVFWAPFWAPDGDSIAFCESDFHPPTYRASLHLRALGLAGGKGRTLGPICGAAWQPLRGHEPQ